MENKTLELEAAGIISLNGFHERLFNIHGYKDHKLLPNSATIKNTNITKV